MPTRTFWLATCFANCMCLRGSVATNTQISNVPSWRLNSLQPWYFLPCASELPQNSFESDEAPSWREKQRKRQPMTYQLGVILSAFLYLHLKHFLCDFPLQSGYQLRTKGIYGDFGGILHASIHALATLPV